MGCITVCDDDLCDCDHHRSEHAGIGCKKCAVTWSPDGGCRAGGFTNSESRLEMLTEFLSLFLRVGPAPICPAVENIEGESFASAKPAEAALELAIEPYARRHHA